MRLLSLLFAAALFTVCLKNELRAANYNQTLALSYGWNAIWLEVEPRDASGSAQTADKVFNSADFNIDQVAIQSLPASTAEFSTDPTQLYNQSGWNLWSRTPVSGETSAITVRGNKAYLVHVSPKSGTPSDGSLAGNLTLSGRVEFYRPEWTRGSYNLTSFSVLGNPTFQSLLQAGVSQFISTSIGSSIKKLNPATGGWEDVAAGDAAQAGRAYWVWVPFNLKSVEYAGPVAVGFSGAQQGGLGFGSAPPSVTVTNPFNSSLTLQLNMAELTFSNLEAAGGPARSITVTKLTDVIDQDLRLFHVVRVPGQLAWQTDGQGVLNNWSLGALEAGQSRTVTLGLDRNWTSGGNDREQLYRIHVSLDGGSVYYYLPVSATNPDLPPTNSPVSDVPSFAGLWVGTVTANAVTSLAATNRAVSSTASRAQLRVLIHVDTNGTPVLLSQVMRMQTKTADPSVPAQEVLILDEAQIPYYEGILERGGKKVGIRYETAAYDMPRNNSPSAQSASFLQAVANARGKTDIAQVTDADVSAHLAGLSTRPPSLQEVYQRRWTLAGLFGPGNTITTATGAPLRLDPFHRTNPFRHAYHPQHGAGYDITRNVVIQLDSSYQSGSGQLTGTYQEVTTGLATSALVARGGIVLQRVSFVDRLQ
jgi:hypothetical protein